jgi:hypothetical protein
MRQSERVLTRSVPCSATRPERLLPGWSSAYLVVLCGGDKGLR